MHRRIRTEILIKSDNGLVEELVNQIINKYKVEEIEPSSNGLVMIKVRETSKKELFYLGEVLVSEAKYKVNGTIGVGIVASDNEELAKNLAIIDAAYNANLLETMKWDKRLLIEQQKIKKAENKRAAEILKTKVDFKTMNC